MQEFNNVGDIVVFYRKRKGMSQTAVAKPARISQPYISLIESNEIIPSDRTLKRISRVIGISIEKHYRVKAVHKKRKLDK